MAVPAAMTLTYSGTDIGKIYLRDIGQRNGLGGGRGIYSRGQDCYIKKSQVRTLQMTGDVIMSATTDLNGKKGVIKTFVDAGQLVIS